MPPLPESASSSVLPLLFPLSLSVWFNDRTKSKQEYGMFSAFCHPRQSWGHGEGLRKWANCCSTTWHPCLLSSFPVFLAILQSLQISPPGPDGAEDLGSSPKEGQRQRLQCGTHEGLFLLPQSPLHHLWTPGVSCFFFLIHFLRESCLSDRRESWRPEH